MRGSEKLVERGHRESDTRRQAEPMPTQASPHPHTAQLAGLQAMLDNSPRVGQMRSTGARLGSSPAGSAAGVVQGKWSYNRDLAEFDGTVLYFDANAGLIYDPKTRKLRELGEKEGAGKQLSKEEHEKLMKVISKDVDEEDTEELRRLGFSREDIEQLEQYGGNAPIVLEEEEEDDELPKVELGKVKGPKGVDLVKELGSDTAPDLTSTINLGEEIDTSSLDSKSGEKTAFDLKNDDENALIIKRHVMPNSLALHEEVETMQLLQDKYRLPVAKVHAMGAINIKGTVFPALLMKRYEGSSKMIGHNLGGRYTPSDNAAQIVANLDAQQAINSLGAISSALQSAKIAIPDLQFLVDDESNFLINDPNGFVTEKQGKTYSKVHEQNMELLGGLISTIKAFGKKPESSEVVEEDSNSSSGTDEEGPDLDYWKGEVERAEKANAPQLTKSILKRILDEDATPEILELIERLNVLKK